MLDGLHLLNSLHGNQFAYQARQGFAVIGADAEEAGEETIRRIYLHTAERNTLFLVDERGDVGNNANVVAAYYPHRGSLHRVDE